MYFFSGTHHPTYFLLIAPQQVTRKRPLGGLHSKRLWIFTFRVVGSFTFSKPWVGGFWWRVLKVVKIWKEMGGICVFPIIFSNSDFLLVRMLKVFRHVCDWEVCAGVPCVDKNTSGSEVLQDTFFDSCLRCRFSNFHLFRLSASKVFLKDRCSFFGREIFGDSENRTCPLKSGASWKKRGNDYLPTTIFHLTCLLFREVSLCFPFLKLLTSHPPSS